MNAIEAGPRHPGPLEFACLDAIDQPVLLLDRAGAIRFGNRDWREFAAAHGRLPEAWLGRELLADGLGFAEIEPFARQQLARQLAAVLAGNGVERADVEIALRLAGERRWFLLHAAALAPGGALVTLREISESRDLETAWLRFATLSDDSPDAVLLFWPNGDLLYSNPQARALARSLGRLDPEADPRALADWGDALISAAAIDGAITAGRWRGEVRLEGTGGAPRHFEVTVQAHVEAERPLPYLAALIHDVTADKRRAQELSDSNRELQEALSKLEGTQQQLLQSEKMASIGQLAAGVAHEINNPIGYVHSNLGSLGEYLRSLFALIESIDRAVLADGVPEALRTDVEEAKRRFDYDFIVQDLRALLSESREGIERVRKIVQDLKDFSYAGRTEAWTQADLHKGLESTLNIVWNDLKYKCEVRREFGTLPPVECLPMQLNQVFMNLLVNAGHAIAERGTITLRTGRDGDDVWIEIADDGCGIPPEVLPRIFDPFFTTKAVGRGTGLGLSLSYGIVKKHHGRIDVESEPGRGSRFRIVLPIAQPPGETAAAPES